MRSNIMNGRNAPDFMLTQRFLCGKADPEESGGARSGAASSGKTRKAAARLQSGGVFAEKLAEEMELPMNARLIRRVKNKTPERLGPAERRKTWRSFCIGKAGADEILPDSSGR